MPHFLELTFTFPVVLFSFLLVVTAAYWFLACLGLVDIELLDFAAGAGLAGAPVTVTITLIAISGWLIAYFVQLLVVSRFSLGLLHYPVGIAIFCGVLFVALRISATTVRLIAPALKRIKGPDRRPIPGQTAIVRSAVVNQSRGQALLNDGGAGLILQIRTHSIAGFKRGDRVVLLMYLADENAYLVISEAEFKGQAH